MCVCADARPDNRLGPVLPLDPLHVLEISSLRKPFGVRRAGVCVTPISEIKTKGGGAQNCG